MSIFDTHPPIIDRELLYKWLYGNYNFLNSKIISSIKLQSERDYNLKILTENNEIFVVKISNPLEKYDILSLQDNMLNHLSKSKIKNLIPTALHKQIKKYKDNKNRDCFVRILSFIEGDIFANNQNNEILCKNFAKFLGYLSLSLKNFDHPAAHREFVWNSVNIEWIKNELGLFSDESKKNIIKIVINSYESIVKNKLYLRNLKDQLYYHSKRSH